MRIEHFPHHLVHAMLNVTYSKHYSYLCFSSKNLLTHHFYHHVVSCCFLRHQLPHWSSVGESQHCPFTIDQRYIRMDGEERRQAGRQRERKRSRDRDGERKKKERLLHLSPILQAIASYEKFYQILHQWKLQYWLAKFLLQITIIIWSIYYAVINPLTTRYTFHFPLVLCV